MQTKQNKWILVAGLWCLVGQLWVMPLQAADPVDMAVPSQGVSVPVNGGRMVQLPGKAKKVSVGSPEVADLMVLRSDQLYLVGKQLGSTNVIVWDARQRPMLMLDVEVTHDLNALKSKLHEFMPEEAIKVQSSQGKLVLSGQVSSAEKMNVALQLARTFTGTAKFGEGAKPEEQNEGTLINMMTIGGAQQVMLEVTVAEVQRSLVRQFDSNFIFAHNGGSFSFGGVTNGASFPDAVFNGVGGDGRIPVFDTTNGALVGPAVTEFAPNPLNIDGKGLFASYLSGNTLFGVALNIAKQNGMAKVLAEPTLLALSGTKADFLSGGEFPVPVPDDDGLTIEYKEFGVGLQFVPVVLDADRINLELDVVVSELSGTNAMTVSPSTTSTSFYVPSLTKRSAKTTVELGNGQTIGIAGLLNENLSDFVEKLPGLGDLPVIGQLFRSQEFRKGETELVILVTPRLAKPIRREDIRLPTDNFVEPTDLEYYLLGKMSRLASEERGSSGLADTSTAPVAPGVDVGSEGQYGHDL